MALAFSTAYLCNVKQITWENPFVNEIANYYIDYFCISFFFASAPFRLKCFFSLVSMHSLSVATSNGSATTKNAPFYFILNIFHLIKILVLKLHSQHFCDVRCNCHIAPSTILFKLCILNHFCVNQRRKSYIVNQPKRSEIFSKNYSNYSQPGHGCCCYFFSFRFFFLNYICAQLK